MSEVVSQAKLSSDTSWSRAPASRRAGLQSWGMLAVLYLIYVLSCLDTYIITMLAVPIKSDLHLTDFQIGLILGPAVSLAHMIVSLPIGWMVDKFPRRLVLYAGVAIWSLATASTGLANQFLTVVVARGIVGAGGAGLSPASMSLLGDGFPRERLSTAIGIYQSGLKIGSAIAFGFGGLVIGLTAGRTFVVPVLGVLHSWQVIMMMIGLPGMLLGLLVFTFAEPEKRGRAVESAEAVTSGATKANAVSLPSYCAENWRLLLPMFSGFVLISLCAVASISWAPTYMHRRFSWNPEHYGVALGFISIASALGLMLKGVIVDWLFSLGTKDAPVRFFSWLIATMTPLSIITYLVSNPWVFLVLYGIVQLVAMPSIMYLYAALQLFSPSAIRGQLAALAGAIYALVGFSIGPTLVGWLTDHVFHSDQMLGASLITVLAIAMPLAFVLLRLTLRPLRDAVILAESRE